MHGSGRTRQAGSAADASVATIVNLKRAASPLWLRIIIGGIISREDLCRLEERLRKADNERKEPDHGYPVGFLSIRFL